MSQFKTKIKDMNKEELTEYKKNVPWFIRENQWHETAIQWFCIAYAVYYVTKLL